MQKFEKLDDESIMEFGKYQGEKLEDIPANYLLWLEDQTKSKANTKFKNGLLIYIHKNRFVLENQAKEEKRAYNRAKYGKQRV